MRGGVISSVGHLRRTPNLGRRRGASLAALGRFATPVPPAENQGSVGDCPTEEIMCWVPLVVR
jgi:hypothetical protein